MTRFRRPGWQCCWLLVFGLVSVYFAFDVLDLDGSELSQRLGRAAIAAISPPTEADRQFRADILPPEPLPSPVAASVASTATRVEIRPDARIRYRLPLIRRTLAASSRPSPSDPL